MAQPSLLSGDRLRARIKRLGLTYVDAAPKLGLTLDGLHKQMRGTNRVSRQTAIILGYLEQATRAQRGQHQAELSRMQRSRRRIGQL
jgi:hypothetical protein